MIIQKVRASTVKGKVVQLLVTIPKDSEIEEGDYVHIEKIKKKDLVINNE